MQETFTVDKKAIEGMVLAVTPLDSYIADHILAIREGDLMSIQLPRRLGFNTHDSILIIFDGDVISSVWKNKFPVHYIAPAVINDMKHSLGLN